MDTGLNITNIVKKQANYVVMTSLGKKENLNPETLDSDNVGRIYCEIKGQMSKVVFDRVAKEQLIKLAKKRDGFWGLVVKGLFYPFMIAEEKGLGVRGEGSVKKRTKKKQVKKRPKAKRK